MNRILQVMRGVAAILLVVLVLPLWAHAETELSYGALVTAWDSNLDRTGSEALLPVSLLWRPNSGTIQLRASSAYMMGRYRIDTPAYANSFTGERMTDTKLGLDFYRPLGKMHFSLAISGNLPTGDPRWETYERVGNIPIIFMPSRFRGRGWGLNTIVALGFPLSDSWSLTASGGYLVNGSVDMGIVGADEVNIGDSALAGFALTRHAGPSLFRLKAITTLPGDGKVNGSVGFAAPPATALSFRWETGHGAHFTFLTNFDLFGKAKYVDGLGHLVTEADKSFGNRLTITPSLEYRLTSRTRMSTSARFKKVFTNDVANSSGLYEAGGYMAGGEQSLKWKMSGGFSSRLSVGYDRILHKNSAYDALMQFTDVTYNVVSFGTGMVFQW